MNYYVCIKYYYIQVILSCPGGTNGSITVHTTWQQ